MFWWRNKEKIIFFFFFFFFCFLLFFDVFFLLEKLPYLKLRYLFKYLEYGKCAKFSNTKVSDKMAYMQIVDTQITLLLKEQSDQDLHCLPFHYIF